MESNSRLLIAKNADSKGHYILKFVELEIKNSPGAVKTLCTFKLTQKPHSSTDTFFYCEKLDAVIASLGRNLAIYTKPENDDDCWVKELQTGDIVGTEQILNYTKTP